MKMTAYSEQYRQSSNNRLFWLCLLTDDVVEKQIIHACLRPGLNRGPSVYKTDALPLSHTGFTVQTPTFLQITCI